MVQPAGSAKRRKRTGGCPLPYRIHFKKQDPGEGGDALRRPWCHSAVQIKEIRRIRAFRLQISSQNCQNSAPPEAPCCTLHFVLRFPVVPPDVLSALALLHPAQDLGARSRIPFLLLRQVCDVRQIPGFAPPVLSAWTVGSAHFLAPVISAAAILSRKPCPEPLLRWKDPGGTAGSASPGSHDTDPTSRARPW